MLYAKSKHVESSSSKLLLLLLLSGLQLSSTLTGSKASPAGYTVKITAAAEQQEDRGTDDDADTDESGWETASVLMTRQLWMTPWQQQGLAVRVAANRRAAAAAPYCGQGNPPAPHREREDWDMCGSFFDNQRRSSSMQENLEYMYKQFGFYLVPDAESYERS